MTMPLADVMQEIERHSFSSEVNLAAGTKAFRRGLRMHALFRTLVDLARDAKTRSAVAKRVEEIAANEIDDRYENRFDAALSAYLTVLGDTAQPGTVAKAAMAATRAQNCWWTVGISRELIINAVSTGWADTATAAWHLVPAALMQGVTSQKVHGSSLQTWWSSNYVPLSARENATRRLLSVLRAAQMQ